MIIGNGSVLPAVDCVLRTAANVLPANKKCNSRKARRRAVDCFETGFYRLSCPLVKSASMNNPSLNRFAFIDVAKGLGIIAVVAGHVFSAGLLRSAIFTFHMPLFFFISGYLFKPKSGRAFLTAKLRQLIVPYFSFLILVYAGQNQDSFHDALPLSRSLSLWGKALLGGRWLYGYTSAFWFAPVLFLVLLTANWLLKKLTKQRVLLVSAALLTAAYANAYFFPSLKVPFNANVVPAALPLFLTGYYLKDRSLNEYPLVGYLFLALLIGAAFFNSLPVMDMKMAAYGLPVLSFAAALAVVLLLFRLSSFIAERGPLLSDALAALGKASLVIMFLHQPVQILLQEHVTENNGVRIVLALAVPYLFYRLFKTNVFCRAFFLGSAEDFTKMNAELRGIFSAVLLSVKS